MRLYATNDRTNGRALWRQKPDWSPSNRFFHCGESKVPMWAAEKWGGKWAVDMVWPAGLMLDPGECVEIEVTSKSVEPSHREGREEEKRRVLSTEY